MPAGFVEVPLEWLGWIAIGAWIVYFIIKIIEWRRSKQFERNEVIFLREIRTEEEILSLAAKDCPGSWGGAVGRTDPCLDCGCILEQHLSYWRAAYDDRKLH